ncbi:MAG: peptidoglycan-binding protein [Rhodospirillaceae bacterium]|nr:peptidoglycan-binding protein [Rhodospirillaceae bacterium]
MDLDDSLNTKKALADLGHMKVPDFGLTTYPDQNMIDGVKSFQKDEGLKVDGIMKPDGPTINRLYQKLSTERLNFHNAANDSVKKPSPNSKSVQVAAGPFTPLLPLAAPVARGLSAALSAFNAAAAAKKLLDQQKKRNQRRPTPPAANDPDARSEIPEPTRQIPGLTPPNVEELSKGGKTKSPGTPLKKPQLDGFPSDRRQNTDPMIFEALSEEARRFLNGVLENRRGNPITMEGNEIVAEEVEELVKELPNDVRERFKHTGGGKDKNGNYLPEEYRRSQGALSKQSGKRHSSYADLTFTLADPGGDRRRKFRLNTGNTLKDGSTPVIRERRELYNMRRNGELGDTADFVPKLRPSMDREEYRRRVRSIIREKFFRFIAEQTKIK